MAGAKAWFAAFAELALLFCVPCVASQSRETNEQIEQVVSEFFTRFKTGNVDGIMDLWDAKSPDFVEAREMLGKDFALNRIESAAFTDLRSAPQGEGIRATVVTDISAINKWTKTAAEEYGQATRIFDLRKVDGAWRIERYAPVEQELADALTAAHPAAEESALLAAHREMVTPELVRVLYRAGDRTAAGGEPDPGERLLKLAIQIAQQIDNKAASGWAHLRYGIFLRETGSYARSRIEFDAAEAEFRGVSRRGMATAEAEKGGLDWNTSRYPIAKSELNLAVRLSTSVDPVIQSNALHNLGEVWKITGNLRLAQHYYDASSKVEKELGVPGSKGDDLLDQAGLALTRGEYAPAMGLYKEAVDEYRAEADLRGEEIAVANLGAAYDSLQKFDRALENYQNALDLCRRLRNRRGEANVQNNIGILQMEQSRYDDALATFQSSYDLARDLGVPHDESQARTNAGFTYLAMGQYALAMDYFHQALSIDQSDGERTSEAQTWAGIANVNAFTGQFNKALAIDRRAILIFHNAGMNNDEARAWSDMGGLQTMVRRYEEAEVSFTKSLGILKQYPDPEAVAVARTEFAGLYWRMGRMRDSEKQARAAIDAAREVTREDHEAAADVALGNALRTGNRDGARKAYEDGLALARKTFSMEVAIDALTGLGEIAGDDARSAEGDAAREHWQEAARRCGEAVLLVNQMRPDAGDPIMRSGFADRHADAVFCYVTALHALGDDEGAFMAAERAKAKSIEDRMLGTFQGDAFLTADERQQIEGLNLLVLRASKGFLSAPTDDNFKAQAVAADNLRALRREFYKGHSLPLAGEEANGSLTLVGTTALLDDKTALIEYVVGDRSSIAFVIRLPTGATTPALAVIPLRIGRAKLRGLVDRLQDEVAKLIPVPQATFDLYNHLIQPLRDYNRRDFLAGIKTLGIVPSDSIWEVPFAGLRDQNHEPLVRTFVIYYAPSLTSLWEMERLADSRRDEKKTSVLLVANPLPLPPGQLEILGDAEAAMRRIDELASGLGFKTASLSEEEATTAAVMKWLPDSAVVNLAAHAIINAGDPMYSGIVLSQEGKKRGEDGILRARQILAIHLHASLVSLPACSTARGTISASEGPLSLAWAFFVAGATSMIATQWDIQARTSDLSSSFYESWNFNRQKSMSKDLRGSEKVSKAEALHDAQIAGLNKPKGQETNGSRKGLAFWAGMMLIGDPR